MKEVYSGKKQDEVLNRNESMNGRQRE